PPTCGAPSARDRRLLFRLRPGPDRHASSEFLPACFMTTDLQTPFAVGIVMTTVVRASIAQALRSVYAQRFDGRMQVLVGIDKWVGDRALLDALIAEAPSHVAVTLLDLGYSTSTRHGGPYPS